MPLKNDPIVPKDLGTLIQKFDRFVKNVTEFVDALEILGNANERRITELENRIADKEFSETMVKPKPRRRKAE